MDSVGGISNSGFLPRNPFHLDVCETNKFFPPVFPGSVYSILPFNKHPKGAKTTVDFLDKCQLRCSTNDSQPFSQPVRQ